MFEMWVVEATAHSGTVTSLRSGLSKTSARGPKIASGFESRNGLSFMIFTKSTRSGAPTMGGISPETRQMGQNCSLSTPPLYATSSYRSTSVPIAIMAFRCAGCRLAACWLIAR